jgi:hypothetical protein
LCQFSVTTSCEEDRAEIISPVGGEGTEALSRGLP